MKKTIANNIDEYIAALPEETQELMQLLRATIRKAAPKAEEVISYQMPAFKLHGALVYFAAYKAHIGFYPCSSGIRAFQDELSVFKNSKGAVQFPLDKKKLPLTLISKIVKYRVLENLKNEGRKQSKEDFLSVLSAPARRALENKGIKTLKQLARFTESDILAMHGIGKSTMPKLRNVLENAGLHFKK